MSRSIKSIEGSLASLQQAKDAYALVVSRFNPEICQALLRGALRAFQQHGVAESFLTVVYVPGAFEIPLVAKLLAESKKYAAILCLGTVIQGETSHFDHIAREVSSGISRLSLETNIPVIFSVLTTQTRQQAEQRSQEEGRNIGFSGALSAMEMVNLLKTLKSSL